MRIRRPEIDPLTRLGTTGVALSRVAIGVGALTLTRPALRALGFAEPDAQTVTLARLAGGRDIALGLHALAVRDDRAALREATLIGAGVDTGDAMAFLALGADPTRRRIAALNALLGGSAAIAGAVLAHRLSDV